MGTGDKGKMSQVLGVLGCWISPCNGPFSLEARFETYEPFISLIFHIFSDSGKPRILNPRIWRSACTVFSVLASNKESWEVIRVCVCGGGFLVYKVSVGS